MAKFLERHNPPKLIEETDNLNGTTSIKVIESIINNLLKQRASVPDWFTGKFYQTLKEGIIPTLYNLLQRIEAEGILPNSFYEASITLTPK